jgi:hypothetical protein
MQQRLCLTPRSSSQSDRHHATTRHRVRNLNELCAKAKSTLVCFEAVDSWLDQAGRLNKDKRPKLNAGRLEEITWQTVIANPTVGAVQ